MNPADELDLRSEFLERLAHELRGLSGITLGALDEMEAIFLDAQSDASSLLELARRGALRTLRLAEQLQRSAQLERGEVEWSPQTVDVAVLLDDVVQRVQALHRRRNVAIEVQASSEPHTLSVDEEWFRAALLEVITESLRRARTRVEVEFGKGAGSELTIVVRDDGQARLEPLLKRFSKQADSRGLGLSWALVAEVVHAQGGSLHFEGGNCVQMTLGSREKGDCQSLETAAGV